MPLRFNKSRLWGALCLILLLPSVLQAVSVPVRPSAYVVDLAGIVDDRIERKLNGYLRELEQKTTAQVAVLTIKTLEGEALADLSLKIAHDTWKLGRRGKDNGLLLLVALKERKFRFEVGYGLEGILPDSLVGSLGRDYLVPFFKKGDYSGGIEAAVLALAGKIAKDAGVSITGMPTARSSGQSGKPRGMFSSILSGLICLLLLFFFLKNPRAFLLFFLFFGKCNFLTARFAFFEYSILIRLLSHVQYGDIACAVLLP